MSTSSYFQFGMRTQIHSAVGAILRLPALFYGMGAKNVLILSDQGLKHIGVVDQVVDIFKVNGRDSKPAVAAVFTDISPDAEIASIHAAVKLARETGADAILALGGGSVLDASKAIKYCLQHNIQDLSVTLMAGVKMDLWPEAQPSNIPHIAVPTTAGTGAEVTPVAVIYNAKSHVKGLLAAPFLEADMAVLDAKLMEQLPVAITIATAMDALTHALESLASPTANHFTDAHAFRAAQLIEETLPLVVENPADLNGRSSLLQASTMACNAVANALNVNMVHNCSHALGGLYRIPHGEANGVLLPIVFDEMRDFYMANGKRLATAMNCDNVSGLSNEQALDQAIARIKALQQKVGFDPVFTRHGIPREELDKIAAAIASDPMGMFYPIPGDKVKAIISRAAGW